MYKIAKHITYSSKLNSDVARSVFGNVAYERRGDLNALRCMYVFVWFVGSCDNVPKGDSIVKTAYDVARQRKEMLRSLSSRVRKN